MDSYISSFFFFFPFQNSYFKWYLWCIFRWVPTFICFHTHSFLLQFISREWSLFKFNLTYFYNQHHSLHSCFLVFFFKVLKHSSCFEAKLLLSSRILWLINLKEMECFLCVFLVIYVLIAEALLKELILGKFLHISIHSFLVTDVASWQ